MGKNRNSSSNQRGSDKSSYQHGAPKTTKHSKGHALRNPARESDERRIFLRNKIEIKRLVTNVQKKKAIAQGEVPTSSEKKDDKKDDLYQLKGAARPAAEHYAPKVEEEPPKPDLFVELKGRLWEATEGQDYLTAVFEYATALHNLMNKSKDAIVLFEEILDHDKEDHLRAKEQIVRCHLDNADAVNARLILEKYADDRSTFLMFSRALIEYLSCHLKETGSSEKLRDEALKLANEANPYIIWLIAYYDIFDIILEENGEDLLDDMIQHNLNKSGSVEEAFTFFKNDAAIWMEIDGIVDWIQNHIVEHELTPPEVTVTLPENIPTEEEIEEDPEKQLDMFHAMYLDMFKTGCDEIEERLIGGEGAGK